MSIPHPLRILLLSTTYTSYQPILTSLDPTTPASSTPTHEIRTSYYTASIPIWIDAISDLALWEQEWLAPEAAEVMQAVGALVVVFKKPRAGPNDLPSIRTLLTKIHKTLDHHIPSYSGVLLAIGTHQPSTPRLDFGDQEWEDLCRECGGWEWIDSEAEGQGRNEYGEKVGIARMKEALEANDWDGADEGIGFDNEDDGEDGFGEEVAEVEREVLGMRLAVDGEEGEDEEEEEDEGEESQVRELEGMMLKMQAVKDMGADMPQAERKKFAAKAVRDIMRTM